MTIEIATPKQTSGGGFVFEDKVVASYLVWMLSGTDPFSKTGRIERLNCQVGVDGWLGFDDLLVTVDDGGVRRRHALSLKSNLQFTKTSAPSSLVRDAWDLLLHRSSEVMDVEVDGFGLVCVPHPNPPKIAIQSLLAKARHQSPAQLAGRIPKKGYASEEERKIHSSCACPDDIADGLVDEEKFSGHILRRMSVLEMDFEDADSSKEATARFICSELTEGGTPTDASSLWNGLLQLAQSVRTSGGGISREKVVQEARKLVELRDFPYFDRDWEKLHAWRKSELDAVSDKVGGTANLSRGNECAEVVSALQTSPFVAVIGASGTGKSVLAKHVAQEYSDRGNLLWLKGELMRPGYVEKLASHHQLTHTLQEVLRNGKREGGLLVLDSVERLLDETDFQEVCSLLKMVSLHERGCGWRLLVTCRQEAWEHVQLSLCRAFGCQMVWSPIRVDYPDFGALLPVWNAFPALRSIALRPHLSQIMRNLKVLDLLAFAFINRQDDDISWMGESQLIEWYWTNEVRGGRMGPQRGVLLQKLAAEHADLGRFDTPEACFSSDEIAVIGESSHLLSTDSARCTVSFAHDLIADWARSRALVAHQQDFADYCQDRFTNPRWHTALRLYGLYLLESDATGEGWKAAISTFPDARGCFLESLVFAGNSKGLLDIVWPILLVDNGKLLGPFLKRFQHVASIPNPDYMEALSENGVDALEASTWERIPLWMYWLGTLSAFVAHKEELIAHAPIETARLARTWLRYTPLNWSGRQDAATLALAVAEKALTSRAHYHDSDESARLPYTAALEVFPDQPNAVREMLLRAAARIEPTEADGELFEYYEAPGTVTHIQAPIGGGIQVAQNPWPDGPFYRVDEGFRRACLESDALRHIMENAPELAQEIVLALLIKCRPPKMEPDSFSRGGTFLEDNVCLVNDGRFHPRFYTRGPFLLFLRLNPEPALQTIIRLIDFATERYMESRYPEESRRMGMDVRLAKGIKSFVGDDQVYHWYHGISGPNVVTSALMAVEKWLYEGLEKKEADVDRWVTLLLESSQSMAFVGMLSEVGRYEPGLLADTLRPLLLVPETYYLETLHTWQGGSSFGTPGSFHEGEWFFNLAREWDLMEHRKLRLVDIASYQFHVHDETREAILSAREGWIRLTQDDDSPFSKHTQSLVATFDPDNWIESELPDGRKKLEFREPEHLRMLPDQKAESERRLHLSALPFTCRKMIEEESRLDDAEILALVDKTRKLLDYEPEEQDAEPTADEASCVLGTAAVLFLQHRDWLHRNSDVEAWFVAALDTALATPPPWRKFDIPEALGDGWEHFAAEIAAVTWAEKPADEVARDRVFRLALAKHYNAAGMLVKRSFERRQELGDEFWQLVNLMLEWAEIRWELRDAEDSGKQFDHTQWLSEARRRFVDRECATSMPDWGERLVSEAKLWFANNHPRYRGGYDRHLYRKVPKIDMQQIQSSFTGVLLPSQSTDPAERARFYQFWEQLLITSLSGTQFYTETGDEIPLADTAAGLTYDSDRWVLKSLAIVVGQMHPDDRPERLWQPILALGCHAEHWVSDFLDHWFMDVKKEMEAETFAVEWIRMLEFCFESLAWQKEVVSANSDLRSLWMSLIGLPQFTSSLWQDEDAGIVAKASWHIASVIEHVLPSRHLAVRLLSWMEKSSASGIRKPLLAKIASVGLGASDSWWKEDRLAKTMARYLSLVWDEHAFAIKQDMELKRIFLALVHRAAGTQEPVAMELQLRIGQGGKS